MYNPSIYVVFNFNNYNFRKVLNNILIRLNILIYIL